MQLNILRYMLNNILYSPSYWTRSLVCSFTSCCLFIHSGISGVLSLQVVSVHFPTTWHVFCLSWILTTHNLSINGYYPKSPLGCEFSRILACVKFKLDSHLALWKIIQKSLLVFEIFQFKSWPQKISCFDKYVGTWDPGHISKCKNKMLLFTTFHHRLH